MSGPGVTVVVVTIHPFLQHPRNAGVADVLIAPSDHRAGSEYCAYLLGRYPHVTLVLVPDQTGGVLIGTRSGERALLRLPEALRSADATRVLAVALFEVIRDRGIGVDPAEARP
ncbi:hypothetical protein [Virgisporangium aurantiacum]|uniref:Uncharacterized protein n=1 Tax=Virgisporangium aurantiacum TaxID=175570 RepID=A0A8J3YZY8_9ACTN|nr:hypothetical protein [Virgisporangium aurantiacum]GIJ52628.1 hypothetical protein Vau01_001440 [Virgisporangium aurantiacum]